MEKEINTELVNMLTEAYLLGKNDGTMKDLDKLIKRFKFEKL